MPVVAGGVCLSPLCQNLRQVHVRQGLAPRLAGRDIAASYDHERLGRFLVRCGLGHEALLAKQVAVVHDVDYVRFVELTRTLWRFDQPTHKIVRGLEGLKRALVWITP
jgi:hypothetical protein